MRKKFLKAGEWTSYSGEIICMRDQAHKKIETMLKNKERVPFSLKGEMLLYAAPAGDDKKIVIGPTTSMRMDNYLEMTLKMGARATVGKGRRGKKAAALVKRYKAPYYILLSGVSAYLSRYFVKCEIIAFGELGPEAVRRYTVKELPLLVAIDEKGNSVF
jgi:fumarate hydratase subunit beta